MAMRPAEQVDGDDVRDHLPVRTRRQLVDVPAREQPPANLLARLHPPWCGDGSPEGRSERRVRRPVVEPDVMRECDAQQRRPGARVVSGSLHEGQRALEELDRLVVRICRPGRVAGLQQILDRLLRFVRLGEVVREQAIHLRGCFAMEVAERLTHTPVQLAAVRLDQGVVRRFLHEPVPEAVLDGIASMLLDDQLEPLQLGQRREEQRAWQQALEQRDAEGPADHRRGGDEFAGRVVEPVESRLKRPPECGRDGGLPGQHDVAVVPRECTALAEIADRLADEVGVATGALCYQRREGLRRHAAGVQRCERADVGSGKRLELELEERALEAPGRAVDQPPRRMVGVAAVDDQEADRGLLDRGQ